MDSAGESRDTCFFVNYKRGLTLPKTELDSMSKRKLTTKFEEEPFFAFRSSILHPLFWEHIRN
ncbi:hypothetical protein [Bacteroides fragilis]|uniref:hypothetical protein n=1 Tax=Bacteroides fragilis TaxID=817 RepID=UPI0004AC8EE7|nr:hypothetical protein DXB33_05950 [Bacteroides fragilis]RGY73801.1 hypothetical protein DXA26_13365 [Bacteroides fragilis]